MILLMGDMAPNNIARVVCDVMDRAAIGGWIAVGLVIGAMLTYVLMQGKR